MQIKRILGVADFSKSSQPAIGYAAQLAQSLHSTLTLAAIASGTSTNQSPESGPLLDELIALCRNTSFKYNIACSFDNQFVGIQRNELLKRSTCQYQLVVIGMNSSADYGHFFKDTEALKAFHQKIGQVLLIPFQCQYSSITNIVYCFELDSGENLAIENLIQLAKVFKCKIHLLQLVSHKFSRSLETSIIHQQEEIKERYLNEMQLNFKVIWTTELAGSTNYFAQHVKADALALSVQQLGFIHRLFNQMSATDLNLLTHYPIVLFN